MNEYDVIKYMMPTVQYIKAFCKDRKIASITPSSTFAAKKLCKKIDFSKNNSILECGPGSGIFSFSILQQMSRGSRLLLVESNGDFASCLEQKITDPRVDIFHDNAINMQSVIHRCGIQAVDYVILGIPFSFSNHEQNDRIIAHSKSILKKGGKLFVYQFSPRIRKYLRHHFNHDRIKLDFEMFNIPPLFIFEALS